MAEGDNRAVSRRSKLSRAVALRAPRSESERRVSAASVESGAAEVLQSSQTVTVRITSNEALLAVLYRARTLIRGGWCRGFAAVDADGRPSHFPDSGEMVAFSLSGAVRTAAEGRIEGEHALRVLRRLVGHHNLCEWNDHALRVKRDVLELLDRAIADLGGRVPRRGGWRISGGEQ